MQSEVHTDEAADSPSVDWSQPLELVCEESCIPVTLCAEDKLPHFVASNPDQDGDYWLVLPDIGRFCAAPDGDATPWGTVRNVASQVSA